MDQSSNVSACLFIDSILYIRWPLKFFPCFRVSLKIPHEQGRSNCAKSLTNLYSLNKRCLRILFCFVCFVFKGRVKHEHTWQQWDCTDKFSFLLSGKHANDGLQRLLGKKLSCLLCQKERRGSLPLIWERWGAFERIIAFYE